MGGNGKLVTLEIGSDGIAVITLSNPPVNALTLSVIAEMKEQYREAMERDDVKGVVLTGTGGKFCGGLDVNILQKVHSTVFVHGYVDITFENSNMLIITLIRWNFQARSGLLYAYGLFDLSGYSTFLAAVGQFVAAFPDRTFQSPLVQLMVENGHSDLDSLTSRVEYETLVEEVLAIMSSKGYYEQKGTTWLDRAAPIPSRVTTSFKLG
nr:peroxisomal fatty acid beta-oxidation multifunctional protein-like [Ipomoea trifida]